MMFGQVFYRSSDPEAVELAGAEESEQHRGDDPTLVAPLHKRPGGGGSARGWRVLRLAVGVAAVAALAVVTWRLVDRDQEEAAVRVSTNSKSHGLFFHPQSKDGSSLIRFNPLDPVSYEQYQTYLDSFLHRYSLEQQHRFHMVNCSGHNYKHTMGHVCLFNKFDLGQCIRLKSYGYEEGRPCIILSLKLPYHFLPIPFENLTELHLDEILGKRWSAEYVGISCAGVSDEDKDALGNPDHFFERSVSYTPAKGFPVYYFPSWADSHYLPPLVLVQFDTLVMNKMVSIKCTAWARNFQFGPLVKRKIYTAEFKLEMIIN